MKGRIFATLVGLLFPLAGIWLVARAIRRSREWRRFGAAPVTLDPFPGSIGGHLGGADDLNLRRDTAAVFRLSLTCIPSYLSGSGKNRSRRDKAVWQDALAAHAESGPNGTGSLSVRRVLGLPVRRRRLSRGDLLRLEADSSFQAQSGGRHMMFYTVRAVRRFREKLVVGDGFRGRGEANAAMRCIAHEFGLPQPAESRSGASDDALLGPEVLT